MPKAIHIISFDIPYPANYGGVIDVFYKIKHLHQLGVKIILHCFQYGDRIPNDILSQYCEKVFYYPRKVGLSGLRFSKPYIVSSRVNQQLLSNLCLNDAAILFEGTHTTFLANHPSLKKRNKILRAHNIEAQYYFELAKNTEWGFKKLYFKLEASQLKKYEAQLDYFQHVIAVSMQDISLLKPLFPSAKIHFIPSFHPFEKVSSKLGRGTYCLYHGNLSVAENQKAVDYLVTSIFAQLEIPLIIAGKSPSTKILAYENNNIKIVANPSDEEMLALIQDAHVNVLPLFQDTGLKLKLLASLFAGRFCIMNHCYLEEVLLNTVVRSNNDADFKQQILKCMQQSFTQENLHQRQNALITYDVNLQAQKLLDLL